MSVLKQILKQHPSYAPAQPDVDAPMTATEVVKLNKIQAEKWIKAKPLPKKKNPEKCIVAKVLKIKKAHVKKGTNVRLAAHQIEAMDRTMTRIVVLGCIVASLVGGSVGFFTARYFYKEQTWTVYNNGFRSGVIERDLKL